MPLRVLFLLTDLEIGGTPRVVRDLAIRLRCPEIATAVACVAPWGPVAGELSQAGVRIFPLRATQYWELPRVVSDVVRIARGYDVVFSFLMHANAVAAVASHWRKGDTRFIQSIQTTQSWPAWHWWMQGIVERAAGRIVVPSASVAQAAADYSSIDSSKIVVIPNAIDVDAFAQLPPSDSGAWHRLGFIGRLDPVKRVPDLVRAIAKVQGVELHIYGDGEDRANIEQTIKEVNVADRVTLHGRIPSPFEALKQIDTLVLPSEAEGFGIVLIEAMAAGRSVIATDVPGIRDVVRHNHTGLLVPVRSPDAIASAIQRLLDDAPLRDRLRLQAITHVRTNYEWENVIEKYRELLLG